VESKQAKKDQKLDMVIKTIYDDISGFTRLWADTIEGKPKEKESGYVKSLYEDLTGFKPEREVHKKSKIRKSKMIPKKSGRMLRFENYTKEEV